MILTCSIGIANPTPMLPASLAKPPIVAIAEFTPTTSPRRFTSGPPELPGLIAASVCTALMYDDSSSSPVVTGRSSALTMPEVTVLLRPSGDPIATTVSPTFIERDEPIAAGRRSSAPSTSSTAMS